MVTVPVKLAAELIVWPLMAPLVATVVIPLKAPAELTSKLVESMTSGDDPPPMLTVPVLDPVLILVLKFELLFSETAAPLAVRPAPKLANPPLTLKVFVPVTVVAPFKLTAPEPVAKVPLLAD